MLALAVALLVPLVPAAAQDAKINYQDHILPIFENRCLGCHNADKKKGDLDLSTYTTSIAGAGSGAVLSPGDAGESKLYKVVAHLDMPHMPPKKPPIPEAELGAIKKWIEMGLRESSGSAARKRPCSSRRRAPAIPP